MSRDLLGDATSALRQLQLEGVDRERAGDQTDQTRARVMRSLHDAKRRRATKLTIAIPLAAILVGSTAWANANGTLDGLFRLVRNPVQRPAPSVLVERKIPEATPALGRAGLPQLAPRQEATALAEPADEVDVAEPEPAGAPLEPVALSDGEAPPPSSAKANTAPAVAAPQVLAAPALAEPAAPPATSQADELYRGAHRAHFGAKQPAAALLAWDAYLGEAPAGRFALEARYNRALCLVRLGRHEAARAALASFAAGVHGGYRQAEAQALLEALPGGPR